MPDEKEKLPPKLELLNDELELDEKLAPPRSAGRISDIGGGGTSAPAIPATAPPIELIAPPIAAPIPPSKPPNGGRGSVGIGRGIGRKVCAKLDAA